MKGFLFLSTATTTTMNTTDENSEHTSSKNHRAPTTTLAKSKQGVVDLVALCTLAKSKQGVVVLVALCMLFFYTGRLSSSSGGGAQSAVSLLRNEKLDDVKNDIVDNDGVGILSTKSRPCKFDYTSCFSSWFSTCFNACCFSFPDVKRCTRECKEETARDCNEYPTTRAAEVRNRTPNSCPLCKKYS